MKKHQHPSNNAVLGAPPGWDQQGVPCDALPVTRGTLDGIPAIVSYWLPSPEELAALNRGYAVALHVLGVAHPPVALSVEAP